MKYEFVLVADNVRSQGGSVVLTELLDSLREKRGLVFVAKELNYDFPPLWDVEFPRLGFFGVVKNNVASCFVSAALVIYFGNIPPVFKRSGSFLFIQNALLTDFNNHRFVPNYLGKLKFCFHALILRTLYKNVDKVVVQNHTIMDSVLRYVPRNRVLQLPFRKRIFPSGRPILYDFIFVGGIEPHKNFDRVLKAWIRFKSNGGQGRIAITLTSDELRSIAPHVQPSALDVVVLGKLTREDVLASIEASKFLLFASFLESLALPLVEATELGTKIVAPDLDFVFEVCEPVELFTPDNVNSITRALERATESSTAKPLRLMTGKQFVKSLEQECAY